MSKNFFRIMLGKKSIHAATCVAENFIGINDDTGDLTGQFPDDWRAFNAKFIPVFLKRWPDKSKIAAGLACGVMWTVGKYIQKGDIMLCPDGSGAYRVGEITGDYTYVQGGVLPHRRPVRWLEKTIQRSEMSDALRNSTGSIGTTSDITAYAEEIEKLIGGIPPTPPEEGLEDPAAFALEKHLEDFLVKNWANADLGKEYDIFQEDGETAGQQYPTDTGPIDIFAISKDKRRLLVVELKRGRASDVVVGQVMRYMGYVLEELAEKGQSVHGVIIAAEDDPRIRRALSVAQNIVFYRYQVSFKLVKG